MTAKHIATAILLALGLIAQSAHGEGVTVYQDPPTANEILEQFGEKVLKTRGAPKTRSFTVEPVADVPEPAQQNKPGKKPKSSVAFPLSFATNSAELSPQAKQYIDSMAEALKSKPDISVHISGHTDKSGSYAINKALSLRRAEAVQAYLAEQGIDPARIVISGEADSFPLNTANPYASENRRVQFDRVDKEE